MGALIASLTAIVAILATWLVLAAVFVGLGLSVERRWCCLSTSGSANVLDAFWIGFTTAILFLQIWHLFLPITLLSFGILACHGSGSLWRNRTLLQASLKPTRGGAVMLLLAAAWVANHAAGPADAWDSAMYHMQAVRWANTYAVVPGLGNLHDRLAFNTASTLYDAMLNTSVWRGRAYHIATGLLLLALLVQALASARRLLRGEKSARWIFDMMLLTPAVAISMNGTVSSFMTDVPPAIVLLIAGSRLFALLSEPSRDVDRLRHDALFITQLAVVAVCLKVSSVTVAPLLTLTAVWCVTQRLSRSELFVMLRTIVIITLVAGVPWVVHGVVLSGYPLFPNTIGGISADWRVPAELARAESALITAFARHSQASGLSWIRSWLYVERHKPGFAAQAVPGMLLPLAICASMLLLRLAAALLHRRSVPAVRPEGWRLLLPVCCGLVIWFWLAPAPRFGFFLFWIAAATCAAQVLPYYLRGTALVAAVGSLAIIPPIIFIPSSVQYGRWAQFVAREVILPPGSDHGLYAAEEPELHTFTTDSGLALWVPPDQDTRCFDAPLPCTPYPARNLSIRRAWDGRPEFITNGDWEQLNWPSPQSRFREEFTRRSRH